MAVLPRQHLRRHVVRSPRARCHRPAVLEVAREPKIDKLQDVVADRGLTLKKKVLWLQIAVGNLVLVHVPHGAQSLLHHRRRVALSEVALFYDPLEELATRAQLHCEVDVSVILERLEELDYVRVVHHLHNRDLLLEPLHVPHLALRDGLDGAHYPGGLVRAAADRAVRALPELLLVHGVGVLNPPGSVQDKLGPADAALLHVLLRHP
mmetsp:Transcript_26791/g.70065  ORF Transcript_26791/g.70065 Transcript_26791/m.70065 type:complete len:208 (+) Transcript_26791:932-1555(+)